MNPSNFFCSFFQDGPVGPVSPDLNNSAWVAISDMAAVNTWLWTPATGPRLPINTYWEQTLQEEGFECVSNVLIEWLLWGQDSFVLHCTTPQIGEIDQYQIWAPKADITRIKAIPVALAFSAPSEMVTQAQDIPDGFKLIHVSARKIPPPNWGELALMVSGDTPPRLLYTSISELSEKSQGLQRQLSHALHSYQPSHEAPFPLPEEDRHMIRELAADYWNAYQDTQRRERPHVPNVFNDDKAWTGLNMGLLGTQAAIHRKDHWTEEVGVLPYHIQPFEHGSTKVWLQKPGQEDIDANLASKELTKHLAALSDLEADILTIQIAQAMLTPAGQDTIITPEAILEYRGIKPMIDAQGYRAGHRTEDRAEVIERFERTAWLRVKVQQWIKRTKSGKGKIYEAESAFILIKEWLRQRTLDDTAPGRLIAWKYAMGTWLAPFMDEGQAGRFFGLLMKKTLEYDPYRQSWEKRLARHFTVHLLIAAKSGGGHIKRRVGALLEESGIKLDIENPQRSKDRFEKALRQLAADGIIGSWLYTNESQLPARHWLPIWLDRTIMVTVAPGALEAGYQQMIDRAKARRAAPPLPKASKEAGRGKAR